MKLEKITHDHLLTKWLKVIIFALLMLAPIFSITVRCTYVVCNKNAYQSYYGETINEKQYNTITSFNDLQVNETYLYESHYVQLDSNLTSLVFITDFDLISSTFTNDIPTNVIGFRTTYYDGISYTILRLDDNTDFRGINNSNYMINFSFTYLGNNFTNVNFTDRFNGNIVKPIYNQYSYLDNVFDYSVNQLRNNQLFNWTQNTGIYTGVNAMTTGIGMTDGTIAILLTYWLLLTIIYVIIDIVLAGFTMLTHMIYNKKAE